MPSEDEEIRITLRMSSGLRDRLSSAASESSRSMNGEIIERLEKSFDALPAMPDELIERIERKSEELKIPVRSLVLGALEEAFPFGYSVGEFIDVWVIPISRISSHATREAAITDANYDPESKAAGLFIKQYAIDDLHILEVYQRYVAGSSEPVASVLVQSFGEPDVSP